jgi:hypothetical protein
MSWVFKYQYNPTEILLEQKWPVGTSELEKDCVGIT